ncbi:MAG: hypothetical protein R3B93_09925 [Bacteroidia bacterium]
MMKLIHEIDHPSVGILMDAFHMNIERIWNQLLNWLEKSVTCSCLRKQSGIPGTGQTKLERLKRAYRPLVIRRLICISFTPEIGRGSLYLGADGPMTRMSLEKG